MEKAYLDSLDYFKAAVLKNPKSAQIYNKMGIVQLQTYHLKEAQKCFERATKLNKSHADAFNNLGVVQIRRGGSPQVTASNWGH